MTKSSGEKKKTLKKKLGKREILTIVFIIGLLAYPFIQWGIFWLYPNIKTFILPFMWWDQGSATYIFPNPKGTFYNFEQMWKGFTARGVINEHSVLWYAFFNTFHALWINLIILPLAVTIGYALSKHVPGEKFFRVIFFLPSIISTVVMCLVFRFMFEGNETLFLGPVTKVLKSLGIEFYGWDFDRTSQTTIWALIYIYAIWTGLSINVVLISSAFQRIPQEITESARLDGFSFFGEFFTIGIPMIMPTISTFLINSVIAVTGFFMQPYLLLEDNYGAGGEFSTIPWLIFQWTAGNTDQSIYVSVATLGIMFSLVIFPMIMIMKHICKKITPDVEF